MLPLNTQNLIKKTKHEAIQAIIILEIRICSKQMKTSEVEIEVKLVVDGKQ